jgi:Zn finger protein HypA/HybF involved in hydrogenase expression
MHDFILAKEIADKVLEVAGENKLEKISEIVLELGTISLAHDEFEEHAEDISLDNLKFGLEEILKQRGFNEIDFKITKVEGDAWQLVSIA